MTDQTDELLKLIRQYQPATVVTGAGISATSGLPTYRNSEGNWIHSKPVEGPEFRAKESIRQRYWCRSYFGWPVFSKAVPNTAHTDIATLEQRGVISTIITQNVDGLHHAAGSPNAIPLHGSLSEVVCLDCGDLSSRHQLQQRLQQGNPDISDPGFATAPDGDANIADEHVHRFNVSHCLHCDGALKPNVVFFGDNVPKDRVQLCMGKLLQSKLLICIGTSLMVFSSFRFCRAAKEHGIPIIVINDGVTRADDIATMKYNGDLAAALTALRTKLQ